jgi:hypothetical protein
MTTLSRLDPEGRYYFRTEQVDTFKRKSRAPRTSITLKNAEGRWTIAGGQAIRMPEIFTEEKMLEVMEALRSGKPLPPTDPKSPNQLADSMMACCVEVFRHSHVSGERFERDGKKWVRVEERIDEEGQKALRKAVKEQVDQMKKTLPLAVRILAAPFIAAMDISAKIPIRSVHLIDEESGKLVSTERFNAEGKQLTHAAAPQRERIADLPDSTFALPAGVELLYPKDLGEYLELVRKAKASKTTKDSSEKAPKEEPEEMEEVEKLEKS